MKDKKIQLLLGLVAVTALSGAIYFKTVYPNALHPVASKADEVQPHWPHSTTPFSIPLINNTSSSQGSRSIWDKNLTFAMNDWGKTGILNFNVKPGDSSQPCYLYPELINFCTENNPNDGFFAMGMYSYWADTGHITSASFLLNDFYFNNKESEYSTPAWRNYFVCKYLGLSLGIRSRYDEPTKYNSCMKAAWNPDNVLNEQSPDNTDYGYLKSAYDHIDDTSSSAASYKVAAANRAFIARDFGDLVSSKENGQILTYNKNLGDGSIMVTTVLTKPQSSQPAARTTKTQAPPTKLNTSGR